MKPLLIIDVGYGYYKLSDKNLEEIISLAPSHEVRVSRCQELSREELARVEIFYGNPPVALLPDMTALRLLQLNSAGADAYVDRALYAHSDIRLANGSGVYGLPISEHLLAMMLSFVRDLHTFRDYQRKHEWYKAPMPRDFSGSTVLIVGLGDIGDTLARKAHALGAHILGIKRTPCEPPAYIEEIHTMKDLDALLPRADFVALCLPATPDTRHVIAQRQLALMQPHSVLLNIGRGSAVDQDALVEALRQNKIGGAGLDVTTPEPLPPDHPLWTLDNVIITSHCAGRSPSNEEYSYRIFKDNLLRFLQGKPATNTVNFDRRY